MGIFGWSLPAGCGKLPDEEDDGPCQCCGKSVDDCICPECPHCGTLGDPDCYNPAAATHHGLTFNAAQLAGQAALEVFYQQQADADQAEYEYWTNPDRKKEQEAFAELMRDERNHQ